MPNISDILTAAQKRAQEKGLPYQGAVLPAEAYDLLNKAPGSKIVDVRPVGTAWSSRAMHVPAWRSMIPESGFSSPERSRSSVDFPAPLRPSRPIRSPRSIDKSTWSSKGGLTKPNETLRK